MPCFVNGVPVGSYTQHFHFNQTTTTTGGVPEVINLEWTATTHVVMEQFIATWEAIPVTSELFTLKKLSGVDPKLDVILRSVDPSAAGESLTDLVCVIPFHWDKGDKVRFDFPNTDDQDCGVEIFLKEVK
jgi:hypothetical protein